MSEDLSRMSNQERVVLLGTEEASKYHGPYSRRSNESYYVPSCTEEGGRFYLSQLSLYEEAKKKGGTEYKMLPCPREMCEDFTSSKKNKKEVKEKKKVFKLSDVRSTKKSKKRSNLK